jgi:hypothetical protein
VWLVGTFLLLHCEEQIVQRSISAPDQRRFLGNTASDALHTMDDYSNILKHSSMMQR